MPCNERAKDMNVNAAPSASQSELRAIYVERAALRDLNEAAHYARRLISPRHPAYGRVLFIMRDSDALVDEFADGGSLRATRPHPDELADLRRQTTAAGPNNRRDGWGWIIMLTGLMLAAALWVMATWLITPVASQAFLDFIAPTAAQARDAGWVALAEGR